MKIRWAKRLLFAIVLFDGLLFGTAIAVVQTEIQPQMSIRENSPDSHKEKIVKEKIIKEKIVQVGIGDEGIWETQKLLALTFDDGPSLECTGRLLDGLKKRGIHATFFLMGENIPGKEELVLRMKAEGHLIANHGYRHVQMTHEGEDAVAESVERAQEMIEAITGEEPEFLRPPYGDWNAKLAERCDLTTVFWNVDSLDWKLRNVEKIVRRVEKQVKNGDIILMHDIFPESVEASLKLVDQLSAEGYAFVTVDELLID